MARDTQKLVDLLLAVQTRIGVLTTRLKNGTATPDDQRELAEQAEELIDLLRSHADDVDAGIVASPRPHLHTEREPA